MAWIHLKGLRQGEKRMKLTGRQRIFLDKILELYRQTRQPLHYTDLAEALDVAKITAYDMLRLLERRGWVRSEYVLPGEKRGPGRSTVVCIPTEAALTLLGDQLGPGWDRGEWERVTAQLLEAIRQRTDYADLLEEILNRLSERTTPLLYTAQMATAVILNLLVIEHGLSGSALVERLKGLGLPEEVGLDALSGLSVGVSVVERTNRHVTEKLVAATRVYQQSLSRLSDDGKRLLSNFVRDVLREVAA